MRTLDADDDVVIAAMLQPLLEAKFLDRDAAETRFGEDAVRLARALSQLGQFGLPPDWTPERGLESAQAEALRKMLLAVIGDVRLVVVRLAEQLQKMRAAKSLDAAHPAQVRHRDPRSLCAARQPAGRVAGEVGARGSGVPLSAAGRVQAHRRRAQGAALRARALHRGAEGRLQGELRAAGIEASIEGRPKHIYSIWRKMQAKHLAFEQLMDIRAARVLVNTVAECYAALGIVHSLWQFIPGEFDDYIATPEGQSLPLDSHGRHRARHAAGRDPDPHP